MMNVNAMSILFETMIFYIRPFERVEIMMIFHAK